MTHPRFPIASTNSEVLPRFDTASCPTEIASIEWARQQLQAARQAGDPQRIQNATMQLHQRILALLRAPSHDEALERGH